VADAGVSVNLPHRAHMHGTRGFIID